jgi:uncharacterized repeat protein (TIGR03803 family)
METCKPVVKEKRRDTTHHGRTTRNVVAAVAVTLTLAASALAQDSETAPSAQKWTFSDRYNFYSRSGDEPNAVLVQDPAGNFYGTTYYGGAGWGVVFKLKPTKKGQWNESVLHNFTTDPDGANPVAGLIRDAQGNLYGTTLYGGSTNCQYGCGTVFELSNNGGKWSEKVLYRFTGGATDGCNPWGGLLQVKGDLYGTTEGCGASGEGTVFELSSNAGTWSEAVLHNFAGGSSDGAVPYAGLIVDAKGNFYGATWEGGVGDDGVVFRLSKTGKLTLLYTFNPPISGSNSQAGLIQDAKGNLYGTTDYGGKLSCDDGSGCGVVFKLKPTKNGKWKESVLYAFAGGTDGAVPAAPVTRDAKGNLYGTTFEGGPTNSGTVFELTPGAGGKWTEKVRHSFTGGTKTGSVAGLIQDAKGNFYGTTVGGGTYQEGMVFELTPP